MLNGDFGMFHVVKHGQRSVASQLLSSEVAPLPENFGEVGMGSTVPCGAQLGVACFAVPLLRGKLSFFEDRENDVVRRTKSFDPFLFSIGLIYILLLHGV